MRSSSFTQHQSAAREVVCVLLVVLTILASIYNIFDLENVSRHVIRWSQPFMSLLI